MTSYIDTMLGDPMPLVIKVRQAAHSVRSSTNVLENVLPLVVMIERRLSSYNIEMLTKKALALMPVERDGSQLSSAAETEDEAALEADDELEEEDEQDPEQADDEDEDGHDVLAFPRPDWNFYPYRAAELNPQQQQALFQAVAPPPRPKKLTFVLIK